MVGERVVVGGGVSEDGGGVVGEWGGCGWWC